MRFVRPQLKIHALFRPALFGFIFLSGCAFAPRGPVVTVPAPAGGERTWRGVSHVHSEYSHDSRARLTDIIRIAAGMELDYVIITDHENIAARAAYERMEKPAVPLLIGGLELSTQDGHLLALGVQENAPKDAGTRELVDWIHSRGGYAIAAHAVSRRTPWRNWDLPLDGFEVYNFAHTFYPQNKFKLAAKAAFLAPAAFLQASARLPDAVSARLDSELQKGPRAVFGGTDAHLSWRRLGVSPKNLTLYFQSVTMYAFAENLNEKEILRALGTGRSYIALEGVAPGRGFSFELFSDGRRAAGAGESADYHPPMQLRIEAPAEGEIRLIHNGREAARMQGRLLEYPVEGAGYFRTVIYRDEKIWIISNPIYVQ